MRTILLFLSLILVGCSSTRKQMARSEQTLIDKTVSQVQTQTQEQTTAASSTLTATTTEESGEVITIHREYDTSYPPDAATGKPPLMSETIRCTKAIKQIEYLQSDSLRMEHNTARITANQTNYDTTTQLAIQTQQTRSRHLPWWFWLLVAGVVLVAYKTKGRWMRRR